jgi:geranylgeranyl diphosphate synthase type II
MITFNEAQNIIQDEFEKLRFSEEPIQLYEPINYILSIGGKRIRPVLTLMSCNLFSDKYEVAIKPAIALEIFHNFTLLHDDIMDNASTRRNHSTVHVKWNNNVAILSGDAMCIKAYQYVAQCSFDKLDKILNIFNQTAIRVCEGQQYDMDYEKRNVVTESEYIRMIEFKTAVLLAACLHIGALSGGADDEDALLMYEYGRNIGLAFQLQDDLLDVYSNEQTLGKETGKDIISNKKTFLLIKALHEAKGDDKLELLNWINKKDFDVKQKIESVKNIYDRLNIARLTNDRILNYFNEAELILENLTVPENRKAELRTFSDKIKERIF